MVMPESAPRKSAQKLACEGDLTKKSDQKIYKHLVIDKAYKKVTKNSEN